MESIISQLTQETKELKIAYIKETAEWAKEEFKRLRLIVEQYEKDCDVSIEKKYYSIPYFVVNNNGDMNKFISIQTQKAEKHYKKSIEKLAVRVLKKGLNTNSLKMSTSYLDPNISTIITDGEKTVRAYTIIASGRIQKPHYRYLVK